MTLFLDTNIILRFLTQDMPHQAERCKALFLCVESGEIALATCEAVVAEAVYVLASPKLYHLPRARIRDLLLPILTLKGLWLPTRSACLRALSLYARRTLDFEDALALAHMEEMGITGMASYDHRLVGVEGITRIEP